MERRYFRNLGAGFALAIVAAAPQMSAQQAAKTAPNLTGVWLITGGFAGRPQSQWSTEALPFTPKGLAAFQANKPGKGPRMSAPALGNDPIGGANPPGLYRTLIYFRPFEIVQLQDKVIQLFEWSRVWRPIYTDGRPVPDDVTAGPYWYGHSVGRWEGDTLVATSLALDERAWFDEWGTPFSADARVEERWQRTAPDKLQLRITVHDPVMYSKPWTSSPINYTLQKKGVEPQEIIFSPMDENTFNDRIRNPAGLPAK